MDNKLPQNFCILPWTGLEVQPNGTVKPCCMYKDTLKKENGQEYKIQRDQFQDIWNSDELSTKGHGGLRQLYRYSTIDSVDTITTPEEDYKPDKIGEVNIKDLENQRNIIPNY